MIQTCLVLVLLAYIPEAAIDVVFVLQAGVGYLRRLLMRKQVGFEHFNSKVKILG